MLARRCAHRLIILALLAIARGVSADDAAAGKYLGSLSCASTACHGQQDDSPGSVGRSAYARWLESDPHARAARTMDSEPFQRILRIASSGRADGEPDPQVAARCAKCHDPLAAPQRDALAGQTVGRGVGCESCHGPAEKWIAVHYDREFDRATLRSLGMIDTRDVHVRAAQCASCHVGDAERDMNHDMIAAGHPPLRFELSAYHDKITRKHWSDAERIQSPDFKTQLWAAGQKGAADAALALLESRAARAAAKDQHTPWPEFAEFDCFACHQRLRTPPHAAVALKAERPGIPGWQPWNLALVGHQRSEQLGVLRLALGQSLVTDPAQIRGLAADARGVLAADDWRPDRQRVLEIVERAARPGQSWAESCQQLLAVHAAYLAWRDERRAAAPTLLVSLPSTARRFPEPADDWERQFQQQLDSLSRSLRFASVDTEWPAFDDQQAMPRSPPRLLTAEEIPAKLQELARQLQSPAAP